MDEEKLIEMYGHVKATRTDIKWIREDIKKKNGILEDHIKDSEKYRSAVIRNTVWRHAFKFGIGGLFLTILWMVFR